MSHNPPLTREAVLDALRTWQRCAQGYLSGREPVLADAVAWYLSGLEQSGALPDVVPLREHCRAASRWEAKLDRVAQRQARDVRLAIEKSNLLARMLFSGEAPRTRPCPIHRGHWTGGMEDCPEGCGLTGWLPW